MTTQPQLLQIPLDPGDTVYTPDWIARDMVEFFKPSGRILEPCAGDGVFLKYLPADTEWCEIEQGRDFFAWTEPVDWIVGNPPFKQINKFLLYSYSISKNIVYLLPSDKPFNALPRARMIAKHGKIVHIRYYVDGSNAAMRNVHRPVASFHFQRGYTGPMYSSIYENPP